MSLARFSPKFVRSRLLFLALVALKHAPLAPNPAKRSPRTKEEKASLRVRKREEGRWVIDRETLLLRRDRGGENRARVAYDSFPYDRRNPILLRTSTLPDARDLAGAIEARAREALLDPPAIRARISPTSPGLFEVLPARRVTKKRFYALLRIALRILRAPKK